MEYANFDWGAQLMIPIYRTGYITKRILAFQRIWRKRRMQHANTPLHRNRWTREWHSTTREPWHWNDWSTDWWSGWCWEHGDWHTWEPEAAPDREISSGWEHM